eukprot:NODE_20857_length_779_cov_2.949387.p6 GENE.NODE_20857_length_779_cov_2.949387~~NODE_20857_length_779_cov_2.949387.p6  ORF type:complete len:56 (-),score=7.06 NODE_20857_length_779_cov_2.949387:403-570(-)
MDPRAPRCLTAAALPRSHWPREADAQLPGGFGHVWSQRRHAAMALPMAAPHGISR